MTREAKVYYLKDKDWEPLKEIFLSPQTYKLRNHIVIFQASPDHVKVPEYTIYSVSDEADKLIEEYGASLLDKKDYLSLTSKESEPLYGEKSLTTFLNW